jgi:putative phage-type endonuclease
MNAVTVESILPSDRDHWLKLRAQDITSTEVPALFGASPYLTKAELWYAKRDKESREIEDNERMRWGTRLQDAIAKGIAEDNGWEIVPFNEYLRRPAERIGSSFDWRGEHDGGKFILEIKNVDGLAFRDGWVETEFGLEAPTHIELQVQHQMLVSGIHNSMVGALVGGNKLILIQRAFDADVAEAIHQQVATFWETVAANEPPPLDFEKDSALIARLYSDVSTGKVIGGNADIDKLVIDYLAASKQAKEAEVVKDAKRAELLTHLGDAEKCVADGYSISAGIVERAEHVVKACSYRNVRVYPKKGK